MNGFMIFSFFFPAQLIFRNAGPEEAKNVAGKMSPPDFRSLLMIVGVALWVYETLVVCSVPALCRSTVHGCVKLGDPRVADSSSTKAVSFSFARTTNTLSTAAICVSSPGTRQGCSTKKLQNSGCA